MPRDLYRNKGINNEAGAIKVPCFQELAVTDRNKALVKPQPGQSIPKITFEAQADGIGELNPGRKTCVSPSLRIKNDIESMANEMPRNKT